MRKTLAEIADLINGEVVGDKDLIVTGLSGIQEAKKGDLTFLVHRKYIPLCKKTEATAIITSRDVELKGKTIIRADNPSAAFTDLITTFVERNEHPMKGVHDKAFIGDGATIGENVSIGPYAIIERHATIGDNAVIYGGSYIGHHSSIGQDTIIYPNVTVREHITIGNRVIIHSGTTIGSDGFGFVQVDGKHKKIPQIGVVVIEDDVEIGANVAIDRARFDKTVIGRGTKIDNLVQVAHNVIMGEDCIIISQCGISGSAIIKNGVILAGQSGIADQITIGEGAIVYSQAALAKSIPPGAHFSGSPARPHNESKRIHAHMMRLPKYLKTIEELQRKVEDLEGKVKDQTRAKS